MCSPQQFFTTDHIYGNPTAKGVYSASAFDPEGLLGSMSSIFQVWIGYQAGYILQVCPINLDVSLHNDGSFCRFSPATQPA